jgi:putative aminopeptidase
MKRESLALLAACGVSVLLACALHTRAQSQNEPAVGSAMFADLREFCGTPAISGYEQELSAKISRKLAALSPQTDNIGDVTITIGSGSPRRLIVAALDEPGFVVSDVTEQGYLRLQRLPQGGTIPLFEELYAAQPVVVRTKQGKWIDGVVAGLSVHLQPGRTETPKMSDIENLYVDLGASSAEEVRHAGVDNLSPVGLNRHAEDLNGRWNAAGIGDRYGAVAVIEALRTMDASKLKGTLTVAFVVQQWTGARGLQRMLQSVKPDEMLYVGRLTAGGVIPGMQTVRHAPRQEMGSGVLIGLTQVGETVVDFPAEIKQIAELNKIPIAVDYSAPLIPQGYLPGSALPGRWAHLGIATAWPSTPAELIDETDLKNLSGLLENYIGTGSAKSAWLAMTADGRLAKPAGAQKIEVLLKELVETYGVSGHEGAVREEIQRELPPWAKTETDEDGNLILHLGSPSAKGPRILVVAHMDEIGFEIAGMAKDGHLDGNWKGGGDLSFFAGHPAIVHSDGGASHPGIMELPGGWDQPGFQWPKGAETTVRIDIGARSAEDAAKMGVAIHDWVTIPKAYRPLLGSRANGRAFDDRVGDAALVSAVWQIGHPLENRDVTFAWSTREEVGLEGAGGLAKRLAAEGRAPDYVFAVDTFVSSDSPLESKRFADAPIGKGFVIRAVDNSNIVPSALVERMIQLANADKIPVQFGATGGGNDGSAFTRFGTVDIALGWPLRYSHSPAEVIDTRDADALSRIVAAIAKSW